jgi:arylsulfatase A-like enzyme
MEPNRQTLPIPDPEHVGLTTYDAKDEDTAFPPIEPLRPPEGAPSVLVILLDDVGFGASSAFGGPCATPTADRLAAGGLRFNRFHTTALCAPTRQALLTGRNHHSVAMGSITELATSAPGYNSVRPKAAAPLAETLKLNGYSTAQLGKCHEVPVWETSPMGPYHQWPTGSGFEYFYGFVGGETNQWYPALYEGTTPIEPDKAPDPGRNWLAPADGRVRGVVRPTRHRQHRSAVRGDQRRARPARPRNHRDHGGGNRPAEHHPSCRERAVAAANTPLGPHPTRGAPELG